MTDYFREGSWAVTDTRVETPKKDFETASITAVEVSRMPLWGALFLLAATTASVVALRHVLYPAEMLIAAGLATVGTAVASQIGWLRVSGSSWRGTETGRVWGPVKRLTQIRSAIRSAQQAIRDGRRSPAE